MMIRWAKQFPEDGAGGGAPPPAPPIDGAPTGNKEQVEYYKRVQKLEEQIRSLAKPDKTETKPDAKTDSGGWFSVERRLEMTESLTDMRVPTTKRQRDILATIAERERPDDLAAWIPGALKDLGIGAVQSATTSAPEGATKKIITGPPAITVGGKELPANPKDIPPDEWRALSKSQRDEYMAGVSSGVRHLKTGPVHTRK